MEIFVDSANIEEIKEIIAGSIRHLMQIIDAGLAGTHVLTIPPKFLCQMVKNPKTDETINEFLEAWKGYKNK